MKRYFRAGVLLAMLSSLVGAECGTTTGTESGSDIQGVWTLKSAGSGTYDWHSNSDFVVVLDIKESGGVISGSSSGGRSSGSVSGWDVGGYVSSAVPGDVISGSIAGNQVELNVRTGSRSNARTTYAGTINDGGMEGPGWSAKRGGEVAPNPPSPPSNLVAEVLEDRRIRFTWSDNSDNEDGFVMFRQCNTDVWEYDGAIEANSESAIRSPLPSFIVICGFQLHAFRIVEGVRVTSDPSNEETVYGPD